MSFFSEDHHVVNMLSPVADFAGATSVTTDIINMALYDKVTFILSTGVTTTANGTVTVVAGTTVSSATNAVPFRYRTVLAPATTNVPTALTAATSAGFSMTASKPDSFYIIEVTAEDLVGGPYSTVALKVTEVTNDPQIASIIGICHHPRFGGNQDALI
jgi:hypothetical protein